MSASSRYKDLKSALVRLRRAMLPRKFSDTGEYRNSLVVHLKSVSFRLLLHAEIESYLEDRSIELATSGWKAWTKSRISSDVTVGLIAFSGLECGKPPGKLGGDPQRQKAYEDMTVILGKANSAWRYDNNNNHGIKEENVLSLFLPLGISPASIDQTLLADLSSYGATRGQFAHSSSLSVTGFLDPKLELQKAEQLVAALTSIDNAVNEAISRVAKVVAALTS